MQGRDREGTATNLLLEVVLLLFYNSSFKPRRLGGNILKRSLAMEGPRGAAPSRRQGLPAAPPSPPAAGSSCADRPRVPGRHVLPPSCGTLSDQASCSSLSAGPSRRFHQGEEQGTCCPGQHCRRHAASPRACAQRLLELEVHPRAPATLPEWPTHETSERHTGSEAICAHAAVASEGSGLRRPGAQPCAAVN